MKLTLVVIASLALALAGCNRDHRSASAGSTSSKNWGDGSSMQTPKGAATGQASEGSTDESSAPKRPSSR